MTAILLLFWQISLAVLKSLILHRYLPTKTNSMRPLRLTSCYMTFGAISRLSEASSSRQTYGVLWRFAPASTTHVSHDKRALSSCLVLTEASQSPRRCQTIGWYAEPTEDKSFSLTSISLSVSYRHSAYRSSRCFPSWNHRPPQSLRVTKTSMRARKKWPNHALQRGIPSIGVTLNLGVRLGVRGCL